MSFFLPLWAYGFTCLLGALWGAILLPALMAAEMAAKNHDRPLNSSYLATLTRAWMGSLAGCVIGTVLLTFWPLTLVAIIIGTLTYVFETVTIEIKR